MTRDPIAQLDRIRAQVDRMRALLDAAPRAPFLASCTLLSRDQAVAFTIHGREHVGAHPDLWRRLPVSEHRLNPLTAVTIVDLDADRRQRAAFFAAMAQAMGGER